MLTEADVRDLLDTDAHVHRLFRNEEFDTWAVGPDEVAKFPRTPIDAAKITSELALHRTIRGLLGDVVPAIRRVGEAGDGGPRFIVHARASGVQGQNYDGVGVEPGDGLDDHIGSIFHALHRVDASLARELGAGDRSLSDTVPDLSVATVGAATEILGSAIERFLSSPVPEPSDRRTLCHADIKGEHVFVREDRRRVTAIIDWADAETCDPAKDYAGLVGWLGPRFARSCIEASGDDQQDPGLADRAVWLGREGLLSYWDDVIQGRENAPIPLITQQLRAAFSD